jgi:outer membrane protein TolC
LGILIDLRFLTGIQTLDYVDIAFDDLPEYEDLLGLSGVNEYTNRALEENRSIQMSESARILEAKRLEAARGAANLKPDVSLAVKLGYLGSRIPGISDDWETRNDYAATVAVSIATTVFDGGDTAANISASESRFRQAEYRVEGVRREVSRFVTQTLHELSVISEDISYYAARQKDAEKLTAHQLELLEIGGGSRLDYLNRKVTEIGDRVKIVEQQLGYALRYVALMNAVGITIELNDTR